jgi:hypothetical protein
MPAATKNIVESIKLARAGAELHVTATLDDATIKAAINQMGSGTRASP